MDIPDIFIVAHCDKCNKDHAPIRDCDGALTGPTG